MNFKYTYIKYIYQICPSRIWRIVILRIVIACIFIACVFIMYIYIMYPVYLYPVYLSFISFIFISCIFILYAFIIYIYVMSIYSIYIYILYMYTLNIVIYPRTLDLILSYPGFDTLVPWIWYPRTLDLIPSYSKFSYYARFISPRWLPIKHVLKHVLVKHGQQLVLDLTTLVPTPPGRNRGQIHFWHPGSLFRGTRTMPC